MKQDYPIYVAWYAFLNQLIDRVEKFPRSVRFTLADRIVNLALDIMENLVEAIYTKRRDASLRRVNLSLEMLRVYIRLAADRKYVSIRQFEHLAEKLDETGRMVGGWIKSDA